MEPLHLDSPDIDGTAFIAPGVAVFGAVRIERAAVVMFGTVIRAELDRVVIGEESNVQDNCVLHADEGEPCLIGRRVTVGHAAVVHGAKVEDGCLVGVGARLLNGATLGEGAWLAAGSLLAEGKSIPPWTLALGTPAKPSRDLTSEEIERQREGVDHYLRFAAAYRRLLGET